MRSRKTKDAFAVKIDGDYEKPGPRTDRDAQIIANALSKIAERQQTGFVTNWSPKEVAKAEVPPFSFYYFQDGLTVDFFNRETAEIDALDEGFRPEQKKEIEEKQRICQKRKLVYIALGPDDELDEVQLRAKLGKTTFKKE